MHIFMITSVLFSDGALLNLESLHAAVNVRELRRVIELIICVLRIVMRFSGDQLSLQNLALVYQRLIIVFQFAEVQLRDIDCSH
jgi:hypothetical protein